MTLALQLLQMALQYGVPAVIAALNTIGKDTITQEDIDALPELIKKPEDY